MRSIDEIKRDGTRTDLLILEVLLDIRELLIKAIPKHPGGRPKKIGRPKKKVNKGGK